MRRDRRWGTTTTHHCFLPAAHPKAQEEVSREVATLRRDVEEQAAALRIFPPCHGDGWYMLVLVLDGIWGIIRLVNYYSKVDISVNFKYKFTDRFCHKPTMSRNSMMG